MHNLRHDLDALIRLSAYRDRAISLRDKGFAGLDSISHLRPESHRKRASVISRKAAPAARILGSLEKWLGMGNKIEAALLTMVQRNRRIGCTNGTGLAVDPRLSSTIGTIEISNLMPAEDQPSEPEDNYQKLDRRIPVLVAANAMQVLTRHASTALSAQTMYCYYAILHELNLATRPDWMIGAARAGEGGNVSVFVTGECMRAIHALERLHQRTAQFLGHTRDLYEKYLTLDRVINSVLEKGTPALPEEHPVQRWVGKAIERMWLDWFVSVHPGDGELCFPLPPDPEVLSLSTVKTYLQSLPRYLASGINEIVKQTLIAHADINEYVGKPRPDRMPETLHGAPSGRAHRYAREYAEQIIQDAVTRAIGLAKTTQGFPAVPNDRENIRKLEELENQFADIAVSIRRVLDPSVHYVESALDRAIADSESQLDAGELVFAACSYGAATNWHSRSRRSLLRACAILLKSVPENGMLTTRQPFHSTARGYKLFPTSCEMVRSLAVLIEKTAYELDETAIAAIGRLLDAIDSRKIDLDNAAWYGWNFDGATEQHQPSVWVSCVTVLSLDRLVRMLDSRINSIILENFDVVQPSKPPVGLNDLIYSDYGITLGCPSFEGSTLPLERAPLAIRLAEMRAHLMRVELPNAPPRRSAFSAVLYGPPQTGKTTLAEALAFSSGVPLVRLSSFDLTRDPGESIESRGRVIFDALSMLTNAVILFDEFESVLPDRDEKHERSLEFLLTGLLPKLVKLHTVAQVQGLVYFLATNHIERIDPAAIRRGRFDLQLPVYNPDALSRAAACLYRLQIFRNRAKPSLFKGAPLEWMEEDWRLDAHAVIRLLNIVVTTIGAPPNELALTSFPVPKQVDPYTWKTSAPYFAYILEGHKTAEVPPQRPEVQDEPEPVSGTRWIREQAWLNRFEHVFQRRLREEMQRLAGNTKTDDLERLHSAATILEMCLQFPTPPE